MFTISAFVSVSMPFGVLISTTGIVDLESMADLIIGVRASMSRMSFNEWPAVMKSGEVVTEPARHHRSDQTLS